MKLCFHKNLKYGRITWCERLLLLLLASFDGGGMVLSMNIKRICLKFCIQAVAYKGEKNSGSCRESIIEALKRFGFFIRLEEDAHQAFLASHTGELPFAHVASKAYRKYLQENFDNMLIVIVTGEKETTAYYYDMRNVWRPLAIKQMKCIEPVLRTVLDMVLEEERNRVIQAA